MLLPPRLSLILASGLFLVATGCGHRPPPRPSGPIVLPPGPRTVAILPFANSTLSVDGPQLLRERLAASARAHGYWVQPLRDTDDRLRGIGVTLGGQLPGVKLSELRGALGMEGAIGGTLLKHQNVVLGIVNTQSLEAEMMELDLVEEKVLFSAHRKVVHQENYAARGGGGGSQADAAVCLASGICGIIGGVAANKMTRENQELANILCARMPPPGAGYPEQSVAANPPADRTASNGTGVASRPMSSTAAPIPGTFPKQAPNGTDPEPPAPEPTTTPNP